MKFAIQEAELEFEDVKKRGVAIHHTNGKVKAYVLLDGSTDICGEVFSDLLVYRVDGSEGWSFSRLYSLAEVCQRFDIPETRWRHALTRVDQFKLDQILRFEGQSWGDRWVIQEVLRDLYDRRPYLPKVRAAVRS